MGSVHFYVHFWQTHPENFSKLIAKSWLLFGHISLNNIIVRFWEFKHWHTQEKEPVIRKIMVVVRKVCLSSPVTTWQQNRNTAVAKLMKSFFTVSVPYKTDCAIIGIPGMQNFAVAVETSNILKYACSIHQNVCMTMHLRTGILIFDAISPSGLSNWLLSKKVTIFACQT